MDAAAIFNERKADVAAFTALLFRHTAEQPSQQTHPSAKRHREPQSEKNRKKRKSSSVEAAVSLPLLTSSTSHTTPAYRRPASANVPVSRVLQEAKSRAERRRRMQAAAAGASQKSTSPSAFAALTSAAYDDRDGGALGFTEQQLRDRTYLCMSHVAHDLASSQDVSRAASRQKRTLTPQEQARLRRLRIKQKHQRVLSRDEWVLWLRRRRRLWQRRRLGTRRRHLRRRLALQHGRLLPPCVCCNSYLLRGSSRRVTRKEKTKCRKKLHTSRTTRITQWLSSHARLVKRFHHRVVSLVVPRDVTHVKTALHDSASTTADATRPTGSTTPSQLRKRKAVPIARVSVPVEPKRKGHRFLQRWATELGVQQRRRAGARPGAWQKRENVTQSPTALDTTLIADLSHHCVYALQPRRTPDDVASSPSFTLAAVAEAIGLRAGTGNDSGATAAAAPFDAGVVLSVAPTARHQRIRERPAAVLHGHLWSATENNRAEASTCGRRRVSTLARHTRVVPAVLVSDTACGKGTSGPSFLLFTEAPVLIPRRAHARLRVQLISAWNPCCRCPAFASVYECWQWKAPPSTAFSLLLANALRRCARVYRRLRYRPLSVRRQHAPKDNDKNKKKKQKVKKDGSRSSPAKRGKQQRQARVPRKGTMTPLTRLKTRTARTRTHTLPRISLVVFPSLPTPFLLPAPRPREGDGAGALSTPYVWRAGFVYHRAETRVPRVLSVPETNKKKKTTKQDDNVKLKTKKPNQFVSPLRVYRTSVHARRAQFHLARRFFGFLLTMPLASPTTVKTTVRSSAQRGKTRVLGLHDRATLLRLVGRPAYPLDYGQSRPSVASQQSSKRRPRTSTACLVSRPGSKRTRSASPAADDGTEEGKEGLNGAAPPAIASFPSYVHILEYFGNVTNARCRVTVRSAQADRKLPTLHSSVGSLLLRCRHTVSAATAVVVVEPVGVVSSSPFFAQRFGCIVAPVWCCFPPPSAPPSTNAGPSISRGAHDADGRDGSDAVPSATSPSTPLVEHRESCWTSTTLLPSSLSGEHVWFALTTPETAAALLRLSASLQRGCPARQRMASRRQRAFDLARGRTARTLSTTLCDPARCSPVQLIRWYA